MDAVIKKVKDYFLEKTFNKLIGILFIIIWAFSIIYFSSQINNSLSVLLLLVLMGIPVLVVCLRYPAIGLYFSLIFSAMFALPGRLFNIISPVGILVEVFTYMLWIAILRKPDQKKPSYPAFWRNGITILLFIILCYYIIEYFNPSTPDKIGWLFFVRKQISFLLFYFIAYVILNSLKKILFFLKFWILLALIIALYGIKQQWFGLADFEYNWFYSDPLLSKLYFQHGFLRKFSFLTDPAAFGIISTISGLFTFVLALRIPKSTTKFLLYLLTGAFLLATAYSGTRTCILMIIAGMAAYAVFTINERRTYYVAGAFFFAATVLLVTPLKNNPVISRVKSAFEGPKEASINLRDQNRHAIQPYIRAHPFGGGLNTSSTEGELYNPYHRLAGFPPDSGYMKILLEQGWVGLAINLILYFVILRKGVQSFYVARRPMIKNIYLALTISMFALIVGQYAQIAISQYPLILFYYSILAILIRLIHFDNQKEPDEMSVSDA